LGHRTLELGLRSWVGEQTTLPLGYVEQLYTFADLGREGGTRDPAARVVSIGYLALAREAAPSGASGVQWSNWYRYFPWEDGRGGRPAMVAEAIEPRLADWAASTRNPDERARREQRVRATFGLAPVRWDEERVLERYELLYEAGLVVEARRDRGLATEPQSSMLGESMAMDHRRILATAMSRLRGKLKYRPVVFELMPPAFTLLQLQQCVEALAGMALHKQNFRRLVEQGGLVERTGEWERGTGGRPAERFRFRREVVVERPAPGVRLPIPRRIALTASD
ncbi:MAG: NUDIX hydrolase, partial [Stellaceae bacterium]